jgi:tetratricopeptide (TPR) repeat protein
VNRLLILILVALTCSLGDASIAIAKTSDKERVLLLLERRQFKELDEHYARLQGAYERGELKDVKLLRAYEAFDNTDASLAAPLTEWIKGRPKSYSARLARGIYYLSIGTAKRGDKFIAETSKQQLQDMKEYVSKAMPDLMTSLQLEDRPIVTYVHILDIGMKLGLREPNMGIVQDALGIDPSSFIVRRKFMYALQPRWGGSYVEMEALLAEAKGHLSASELNALESIIYVDKGRSKEREGNTDAAISHYTFAAQLVADLDSYVEGVHALTALIRVRAGRKEYVEALPAMDRLLAHDPNRIKTREVRGYTYYKMGRYADALRDYLVAAELGDAYAQYRVGTLYAKQIGTQANQEMALKWLRRSASQGNAEAQRALSKMQQSGR